MSLASQWRSGNLGGHLCCCCCNLSGIKQFRACWHVLFPTVDAFLLDVYVMLTAGWADAHRASGGRVCTTATTAKNVHVYIAFEAVINGTTPTLNHVITLYPPPSTPTHPPPHPRSYALSDGTPHGYKTTHLDKDGQPIGPRGESSWLYVVPWGVYKVGHVFEYVYMSCTSREKHPVRIWGGCGSQAVEQQAQRGLKKRITSVVPLSVDRFFKGKLCAALAAG